MASLPSIESILETCKKHGLTDRIESLDVDSHGCAKVTFRPPGVASEPSQAEVPKLGVAERLRSKVRHLPGALLPIEDE